MTLLPPDSAYVTAVRQDDELLEDEIDRNGMPKPSVRPSSRGWTQYRQDLADIKDFLRAINAAVRHDDRPFIPTPRPEWAIDRVEKRERKENTNFLYAQLGIDINDYN